MENPIDRHLRQIENIGKWLTDPPSERAIRQYEEILNQLHNIERIVERFLSVLDNAPSSQIRNRFIDSVDKSIAMINALTTPTAFEKISKNFDVSLVTQKIIDLSEVLNRLQSGSKSVRPPELKHMELPGQAVDTLLPEVQTQILEQAISQESSERLSDFLEKTEEASINQQEEYSCPSETTDDKSKKRWQLTVGDLIAILIFVLEWIKPQPATVENNYYNAINHPLTVQAQEVHLGPPALPQNTPLMTEEEILEFAYIVADIIEKELSENDMESSESADLATTEASSSQESSLPTDKESHSLLGS